jgi:membrane protein DedA with SNARE-associated domain
LIFEVFGLIGWVAIYAGIGWLAGESWAVVARWVGVGGAAAFVVAGVAIWITWRVRRNGRSRQPAMARGDDG